ncbi:unnamed protein product, partial [Protopolystoma xenopodis]
MADVEPGHVVVVGAASRGIISRGHQYDPNVYQAVYSPNPFDRVTDDDIERYKENVERKIKGLPSLEEEEAAIAAELARQEAIAAMQEASTICVEKTARTAQPR